MLQDLASRRSGLTMALGATLLWSLAGLFSRLAGDLDIGSVLCGRAGFGGALGLLVVIHDWRLGRFDAKTLATPMALVVVLLAAVSVSGWVAALMTTTVADVMVIYSTLPFFAAGLAYALLGERASRRTLVAAGIAAVGILVMVAGGLGHGRWLGQVYALLTTATFALLVVLQRRWPDLPATPVNTVSALIAAAFGYAIARPVSVSPSDLIVLVLFGLTTITLAFPLFMAAVKRVPAAEASLIAMLDAVLAPLWVFLIIGERPNAATLIGGAIVLAAAVWRLAPELKRSPAWL